MKHDTCGPCYNRVPALCSRCRGNYWCYVQSLMFTELLLCQIATTQERDEGVRQRVTLERLAAPPILDAVLYCAQICQL